MMQASLLNDAALQPNDAASRLMMQRSRNSEKSSFGAIFLWYLRRTFFEWVKKLMY